MDRFLPAQASFKSRSACLGLRLSCLLTAASGPPSGGAVPATLTPTLLGTAGGTARTHMPGDVGIRVRIELHTDPPSGDPADRVGRWSPRQPGDLEVHRLLSPSSCGALQASRVRLNAKITGKTDEDLSPQSTENVAKHLSKAAVQQST